MENIDHVFSAAHLLQMNDVVQECVKWMRQNITKDNCFKFQEMADRFSVENIETRVTQFILDHFVDVSETKEFENISKAALIKYLSSDLLETKIEEVIVFRAARKWILANEIPGEYVAEIFAHVRLGLVPQETIVKEILYDNLITANNECSKLVSDAMLYHANMFNQPLYQGTLNKPRGEEGLVIVPNSNRIAGFNVSDDYLRIRFMPFPLLNRAIFRCQLDIPVAYESMSAIQIRNFLFLFGVNCNGFQNFSKRFDASTDTWLELAAVPRQAVVGAAIAYSKKQIFLLGGMSVDRKTRYGIDDNAIIDSVYAYDIPENSWSGSRALPVKLMYAAAAELQGNIYLTGCIPSNDYTSNMVWSYVI